MYIILEYYLIENFIINFFILYITDIITKTKANPRRILMGAAVASLYSLVFFSPSLYFMTGFIMKIMISIIIVKISFNSRKTRLFIQQILGFYTTSFILAGMVTSISWNSFGLVDLLLKRINLSDIFRISHLILGIGLGSIIAYKIFNYNTRVNIKEEFIVEIEVYLGGLSRDFRALIDTGNDLISPLDNRPVFVVELDEIKEILPKNIRDIYKDNYKIDYNILETRWQEVNTHLKLKIIPFKSLGSDSGILLGFKPDYIRVKREGSWKIFEDIIIGIYPASLSQDREYAGLINYKSLIGGDCIEETSF